MPRLESIDHTLFYLINRDGRNSFFDVLMPIMSDIELFYIPIALIWLFLMTRNRVKYRVVAVAALLLICFSEWVSSDVLKPAFGRCRPYHQLSNVHLLSKDTNHWRVTPELKAPSLGASLSLPSSHATNIFAAAFFMSYFFRRYWPLFYAIAFTVGYSRVYLGVHFPLDVVMGAAVGSLCAMMMAHLTHFSILIVKARSPKPRALKTSPQACDSHNETIDYRSGL